MAKHTKPVTERLYRFTDLHAGVQRKLAHQWAQVATDVADIDGKTGALTDLYALECLQTDLAFKYTADGVEV